MKATAQLRDTFAPFLTGSLCKAVPTVPENIYLDVFEAMKASLSVAPILLRINGPLIVVGDLHGSFIDLVRIIRENGPPEETSYLFLGDYVDRGPHSLACLGLIGAMMINNPERVFMLRGNHEFAEVNYQYGFYQEVMECFNNDAVYISANAMFEQMPLAAVIKDKLFCVHGGISPKLISLSDIERLKRPINSDSHEIGLISDLVWSDPQNAVQFYATSERGVGKLFGFCAVNKFLEDNNLTNIIRAHELVLSGVKSDFRGKVITVFSSSNYCKQRVSVAGFLKIDKTAEIEMFSLKGSVPKTRSPASTVHERPNLAKNKGSIPRMFNRKKFCRSLFADVPQPVPAQEKKAPASSMPTLPPLINPTSPTILEPPESHI